MLKRYHIHSERGKDGSCIGNLGSTVYPPLEEIRKNLEEFGLVICLMHGFGKEFGKYHLREQYHAGKTASVLSFLLPKEVIEKRLKKCCQETSKTT